MPAATKKQLKVFFHAIDGVGHINACVGMAQALAQRGHKIYFLLNDAFAGQFVKFGFEEILLTQKPKEKPVEEKESAPNGDGEVVKKNPVKEMAQLLIKMGMLGPKSPYEKLLDQMNAPNNFMEGIYNQMVEYNPQIGAAISREQPDLFIIDSFLIPPSIRQANLPWIMLLSPNPSFLYKSDKLPPFGSGYPSNGDRSNWEEFRTLHKTSMAKNFTKYEELLNKEFNYEAPPKGEDDFFTMSPYLNIYGYPAELDYDDVAPRPSNLAALDAFCRVEPEPFELPQEIVNKPGDKLIYVSLGSMGSIDVDLMQRILSVLEKTPHKYIVSKGQRGEEYELPSNCWGEKFLPQPKILPLVDLVITHGGNNTITETMTFGKPMIVMPLFGDQYDNAQRVDEKGFGIRIDPYTFKDDQLTGAIEKLLADIKLQVKAKAVAERMAKSNSKDKVCEKIEQVVATFRKV